MQASFTQIYEGINAIATQLPSKNRDKVKNHMLQYVTHMQEACQKLQSRR